MHSAIALEPKADTHEEKLVDLDKQMDETITENLEHLADEDRSEVEQLLGRHYSDEDVDLLKEKLPHSGSGASEEVIETFETEITTMRENIEELEMIIEQKSEEITYLTKLMDEKEKRMRESEEELVDLRRYKSLFEDRDNKCTELEILTKKLHLDNSDLKMALEALEKERRAEAAQHRVGGLQDPSSR